MNRRNFIKTSLATAGGLLSPKIARAISKDEIIINPFIRPNINYNTLFQGTDWNKLTDEQTRNELMKDALILGRVAEISYNNPKFLCHHYSTLDLLKIHGFKKENPNEPDIPQIFFDKGLTQEKIGEFNLPLYYVLVSSPELQSADFNAHTLVGSPIGNEDNGNPKIWNNWRLWEPQNNSVVNIGYNFLPKNSDVAIKSIKRFGLSSGGNNDLFYSNTLTRFEIKDGVPNVYYTNPNLVLTRPIITNVAEQTPTQFNLNQNYPNPFNSDTTINYSLENPGNVELKIFGSNGQHIDTLVNNEYQSRGSHSKLWSPSGNLASGNYLYRLRVGDKIEKKKMMLVK